MSELSSKQIHFLIQDLAVVLGSLSLLLVALQNNSAINGELSLELEKLNITSRFNQSLLIFNRVPKAGSQTLNFIIGALRSRNNFSGYTSLDGMPDATNSEKTYIPDVTERKFTIRALLNVEGAFLKHQNFLNFSEFNSSTQNPIYVNFVRDPVERLISWYYYIRNPTYMFSSKKSGTVDVFKPSVGVRQMKTTFEDCVLDPKNLECKWIEGRSILLPGGGSHSSQMSFFCGNDRECMIFNGEENFRRAMQNVDQYFSVVGVLEEWEKSLEVLEKYIPRYFSGAREVVETGEVERTANKNTFKPKVQHFVRKLIAQNVSREIEFYNFCKQRLHKQYLALQ